jgi:D-sedoheptulose 7-phosphate isomerase
VIENYIMELVEVLNKLPQKPIIQLIGLLERARAEGHFVFVFGNGGSAATATHMACDLGKNTVRTNTLQLRTISLNDNLATLSAYANDQGYESVFAEPLRSLAKPGDVVIAISGSGNSPNVLRAVEVAHDHGLTTVALTGLGGRLKDMVDICVAVPSDQIEQIEDVHLIVDHILTVALREQKN